ncbi:hypothetical protein Poli38472_002671 [Pythium oligandrum]|uniref:Uncharacterized protein n=1 Tax=Pythium oligandrum TaxID=41045 RepID=A0A8K1CI97_PYTOL|nr:hypothetical protein Poli38472_002671 [Pythium oligandrum]|eukprot:TMW63730.1 hypothetical protein Poli38472_002671 [Pythium oligandrum]
MLRKGWYQLVDVNGRDVGSETSVKASKETCIKAIKKQVQQEFRLVETSSLQVFVNQAAFDNKEQLVDDTICVGDQLGKVDDVMIVALQDDDPSPPAKKRKVDDASNRRIQVLRTEQVTKLPLDLNELQEKHARELPAMIPISEHCLEYIRVLDSSGLCTKSVEKLFVERHDSVPPEYVRIVWNVLNPMVSARQARLKKHGTFRRFKRIEQVERPDLSFYISEYPYSKVCIFRGVEESVGDIRYPLKKLWDGVTWRYGDAPCVFGYAAVGRQVSLVMIREDKLEVMEEYDLSELDERLALFLALPNLSTLFRPVLELMKPLKSTEYFVNTLPNEVHLCAIQFFANQQALLGMKGKLEAQHETEDDPIIVVVPNSELEESERPLKRLNWGMRLIGGCMR